MSIESILSNLSSINSCNSKQKLICTALMWILLWCSVTKETTYWQVKIKWNPRNIYNSCENSENQWSNLEIEIRQAIKNELNGKKKVYKELIEWNIDKLWFPDDIKSHCIEKFDDVEIEYISLWFLRISIKFQIQDWIQNRILKIKKWSWSTIYTTNLTPKVIKHEVATK